MLISDDEIYKLSESGLSDRKIVQYFIDKGIKVSLATIKNRCKKIYEEKKKEEGSAIKKNRNKIINEKIYKKIYKLREDGLTYKKIAQYFNEQGIKISYVTVKRRCEEIYKEKGQKEPEAKRKKIIQITNEEIYNLREQGWTYRKIAQYFNEQGVEVSFETVRVRCKEIYKQKGQKEPETKRKKIIQITGEEIYKLREEGLTYKQIMQYFNEQGIEVSYATIQKRGEEIYQHKEKGTIKAIDKNQKLNTTLADLEKKVQDAKENKKKSEELLAMYKELESRYEKEYEQPIKPKEKVGEEK